VHSLLFNLFLFLVAVTTKVCDHLPPPFHFVFFCSYSSSSSSSTSLHSSLLLLLLLLLLLPLLLLPLLLLPLLLLPLFAFSFFPFSLSYCSSPPLSSSHPAIRLSVFKSSWCTHWRKRHGTKCMPTACALNPHCESAGRHCSAQLQLQKVGGNMTVTIIAINKN
jgi:hypothetical protein